MSSSILNMENGDINACVAHCSINRTIELARQNPEQLLIRNQLGAPLIFEILSKTSKFLQRLSEANLIDPTATDVNGNTLLHRFAVLYSHDHSEFDAKLDILMKHCYEQINQLNNDGYTPLDTFVSWRRYRSSYFEVGFNKLSGLGFKLSHYDGAKSYDEVDIKDNLIKVRKDIKEVDDNDDDDELKRKIDKQRMELDERCRLINLRRIKEGKPELYGAAILFQDQNPDISIKESKPIRSTVLPLNKSSKMPKSNIKHRSPNYDPFIFEVEC